MKKTAVIGASGFLGRHLLAGYRAVHPDCIGTAFSSTSPDLLPFDIRKPELVRLRLEESGYHSVVIASARPNVMFCEEHREEAYDVNVRGTLELVRQIGRTSLRLVFFSSDYVFEGKHGGYGDTSPLMPTTEYGRQKAEVEREIPSLSARALVLRLSKVYGIERGDGTLLDEIASALAGGSSVRAASDQIFNPTYVGDIVRVVIALQDIDAQGTMNVCAPQSWRRFDIAKAVAAAMGREASLVQPVSLHDIPGMESRPLNTSMQCARLSASLDMQVAPLEESIRAVVKNYVRYQQGS